MTPSAIHGINQDRGCIESGLVSATRWAAALLTVSRTRLQRYECGFIAVCPKLSVLLIQFHYLQRRSVRRIRIAWLDVLPFQLNEVEEECAAAAHHHIAVMTLRSIR